MQRNIKLRNKSHHITILALLFWVWKPLKNPKMEKTGATVRYRFYYEKIWNFYNIANSPKPGECSYTAESMGKTPAKTLAPSCKSVWPSCTVSHVRIRMVVQLYNYCMESVPSLRQLYGIYTVLYDLPLQLLLVDLCGIYPIWKLCDLVSRSSIFPSKSSILFSLPVCIMSLLEYKCVCPLNQLTYLI